jgi:hypothetical protein
MLAWRWFFAVVVHMFLGVTALERKASVSFFDAQAFADQQPFDPSQPAWAENCLGECFSLCRASPPKLDAWLIILRWSHEEDCIYR